MYANIIIDISHEKVDKPFQYKIPEALDSEIQVGVQVRIPFGKGNHERKGYVVGVTEEADFDPACRRIFPRWPYIWPGTSQSI